MVLKTDKNQNRLTNFISKTSITETDTNERIVKRKRDESRDSKFSNVKEKQEKRRIVEEIKPHQENYDLFVEKLNNLRLPEYVNKKGFKRSELELERLKCLLNDWIFWTSKDKQKCSLNLEQIDPEDLDIFSGYLHFVLNVKKDLEKLSLTLKIFKRLVEKNGSNEWISAFKEIFYSLQSEFFQQYDSTIKLD